MNTMTTMNTNFVTLFFAFRPSLQSKQIYIEYKYIFCYFETPLEALLQREINMTMYMRMMAKIGRANEVMKNPM